MSMTNVFFQCHLMLSHRYWKGNGVFGKEGASTQLQLYLLVLRFVLHFGIIFTHIFLPKREKVWLRAYISLTSIRFWWFMPKGEKVWAQSKRTAPPPNLKWSFQFDILLVSKGGESSIFKNCKTLLNTKRRIFLNTKRRILFRGSFVLVKGKAFETGGENFKSWKCVLQSYSYTFDYLQNNFEKNFTKDLQKQNSWCKCGPKF
jgi:hypothetical protein